MHYLNSILQFVWLCTSQFQLYSNHKNISMYLPNETVTFENYTGSTFPTWNSDTQFNVQRWQLYILNKSGWLITCCLLDSIEKNQFWEMSIWFFNSSGKCLRMIISHHGYENRVEISPSSQNIQLNIFHYLFNNIYYIYWSDRWISLFELFYCV